MWIEKSNILSPCQEKRGARGRAAIWRGFARIITSPAYLVLIQYLREDIYYFPRYLKRGVTFPPPHMLPLPRILGREVKEIQTIHYFLEW